MLNEVALPAGDGAARNHITICIYIHMYIYTFTFRYRNIYTHTYIEKLKTITYILPAEEGVGEDELEAFFNLQYLRVDAVPPEDVYRLI